MKFYVNCDYEKLQDKTATREPMFRRDNKKMPYDRVRLVQETGKYSSKQSDKSRVISLAQRRRNKVKEQELANLIAEEQQIIEEDFIID
jgi:hypothetical protein